MKNWARGNIYKLVGIVTILMLMFPGTTAGVAAQGGAQASAVPSIVPTALPTDTAVPPSATDTAIAPSPTETAVQPSPTATVVEPTPIETSTATAQPAQLQGQTATNTQAGTSGAPASNPLIVHPYTHYKPVCPLQNGPDSARCNSQVETDALGQQVVAATLLAGSYGPSAFRGAYGVSGTSTANRTVAIVDAYDDPTALNDLDTYSDNFGIPRLNRCAVSTGTAAKPCIQKVDQNGGTNYPASNSGWALEIALDLEAVHAMCQNCNILLVEATSNSNSNLISAADQRAYLMGANVISNSWGGSESSGETTYDSTFNHPGVAFVFSSGDGGYGVEYPAASPNVTAVGGTTLLVNSDYSYNSETAWNGAGSGCSSREAKPGFQHDTGCPSHRTVVDVSADADPNTGAAVYTTSYTSHGWLQVGGTSLAAPLVASVIALAGGVGNTLGNSLPYANLNYGVNLRDVTSGNNGSCGGSYLCTAVAGYDGPTGLGTPRGSTAFTPISTQTLTVTKSGMGSGTVTSSPAGINCGSTCSYAFANNTVVTLTAAATSPSIFGGWSGAGCSGTGTCTVTMSAAQSVTATFTATTMPASWYGSAVISADHNVVAIGRPQIGDQVMAYDGFTSGSTTVYLPMLFNNIWGYDSAFYIQNLDTANPASITEKFYDWDGNLSCTQTDSIPTFSSHGTWVPDLTCLPASWVGSLVVTSNRNIVGVGRPHLGTEITTYNGFASGSLTMYLPMLYKNSSGDDSAFYVQNVDPVNTANVTEKFYDTTGNLSCTLTDSIPPLSAHGTWTPDLTCLPASWEGALVVTSDRNIVAVGRPHLGTAITTYDGLAIGNTNFTVPSLFKDLSTYESALYVQNTSPTTQANITMKFYDMTGNLTCTQTDSIPLLSSHGYWFPNLSCLGSSWEGSVKITSNQAVVAVARLHNGADVGSFDGFIGGNPLVYIPMLFNNMWDTYNSTLTVQNADASNAANLTIKFYDVNGNYTCKRTDSLPALGQIDYWLPSLFCTP